MQQSTSKRLHAAAPASKPMSRRPSDKQLAVRGLLPIFSACKAKGLPTDAATRERRCYAVNRYLNSVPTPWIESFKDLLADVVMVEIVASAISDEVLSW